LDDHIEIRTERFFENIILTNDIRRCDMISRLLFERKNSAFVDCCLAMFLWTYLIFAVLDAELFNGFVHEKIIAKIIS